MGDMPGWTVPGLGRFMACCRCSCSLASDSVSPADVSSGLTEKLTMRRWCASMAISILHRTGRLMVQRILISSLSDLHTSSADVAMRRLTAWGVLGHLPPRQVWILDESFSAYDFVTGEQLGSARRSRPQNHSLSSNKCP